METQTKIISGVTEEEIWKQIEVDLSNDADLLEYHATIMQDDHSISLDIDIDLGGGFESGISTTNFSTVLKYNGSFRFAVHRDDFIDDIGKFFGMQDVEVGYPDLDKHLIIKTNDENKVKSLFEDNRMRVTLTELNDFDFGIHTHQIASDDSKHCFLELNIEDGIMNTGVLRELYNAFYQVLVKVEGFNG
jgi:hypothetical protein